MGKSPELTERRFSAGILILSATALFIASLANLPAKAPWVDELYTWYGIRHETFGQFAASIASGVNFSPPLYFFLNWMGQLAVPLSLDALRIESLLWILGGAFLAHRAVRPIAGDLAAAAGVAVVLLQSALLREQALEARQYGMLFFCGAAVALTGSRLIEKPSAHKSQAFHFLAHFGLSLTHYLGIVFSGTAALALMLARKKTDGRLHWPKAELLVWILAIILHLWLLSLQSSHLNTWTKSNSSTDLAALYLDSFLPLAIALPFLVFLFTKENKIQTCTKVQSNTKEAVAKAHALLLSLFWLAIPGGVWLLSHISELNLFKGRYFMPKEVGWMILLSILLSKLPRLSVPSLKNHLPHFSLTIFSLAFLSLASQRILFSLDPARNYHHRLLLDASILKSSPPKVYAGDHIFFPNHYSTQDKTLSYLLLSPSDTGIYQNFSSEIQTMSQERLELFKEYIWITDKELPSKTPIKSSIYKLPKVYHMNTVNP